MPGPNGNPPQNEAPQSLRDIAEAAYDSLENEALSPEPPEGPSQETPSEAPEALESGGQPRDTQGRWIAKDREAQPGEAIRPQRPDPAPQADKGAPAPAAPDPASAQAPRSNQAPEHWSAEDKKAFSELPPPGQQFLLRRHGEMEAEFTRKAQTSAGAVQFAQALTPVFTDPVVAGTLQQQGVSPAEAIHQWAGFHKRAMSQNLQDRFGLLVDLTERMGLDPARIFVALNQPQVPPGLSEADMKDPALKFFADTLGKTSNELQTLRGELQQMRNAETQSREQVALRQARWSIDQYADEKKADGTPVRPHFDAVLPLIIDMFKANPQRDMNEVYDAACWAHPEVRKQLLAAQTRSVQSQADVARARVAQRGNTRGLTAPVSRPNGASSSSQGALRDAIEKSAEEIGY